MMHILSNNPYERLKFLALVMLYLYKGCRYKQIAKELGFGCCSMTVGTWVQHARTILRNKDRSRILLIEQMELQMPLVKNVRPISPSSIRYSRKR